MSEEKLEPFPFEIVPVGFPSRAYGPYLVGISIEINIPSSSRKTKKPVLQREYQYYADLDNVIDILSSDSVFITANDYSTQPWKNFAPDAREQNLKANTPIVDAETGVSFVPVVEI